MNIFNEIIFGIRSIIEKGEFFTLRKGGWSIFEKEYFSKTFLVFIENFSRNAAMIKKGMRKASFHELGGINVRQKEWR